MTSQERKQADIPSSKPDVDAWKTGQRGREPLPLGGYATIIGVFGAAVGGMLMWASQEDHLLDQISVSDLAVLGIGSQRLARMVSKDRVSTVLRQPFTIYEGTEGALPGESSERARREDSSLRTAIGELLVCPYCMSSWSATALFGTYLASPKLGRTVSAFLTSISLAEIMQSLYTKVAR